MMTRLNADFSRENFWKDDWPEADGFRMMAERSYDLSRRLMNPDTPAEDLEQIRKDFHDVEKMIYEEYPEMFHDVEVEMELEERLACVIRGYDIYREAASPDSTPESRRELRREHRRIRGKFMSERKKAWKKRKPGCGIDGKPLKRNKKPKRTIQELAATKKNCRKCQEKVKTLRTMRFQ